MRGSANSPLKRRSGVLKAGDTPRVVPLQQQFQQYEPSPGPLQNEPGRQPLVHAQLQVWPPAGGVHVRDVLQHVGVLGHGGGPGGGEGLGGGGGGSFWGQPVPYLKAGQVLHWIVPKPSAGVTLPGSPLLNRQLP